MPTNKTYVKLTTIMLDIMLNKKKVFSYQLR